MGGGNRGTGALENRGAGGVRETVEERAESKREIQKHKLSLFDTQLIIQPKKRNPTTLLDFHLPISKA